MVAAACDVLVLAATPDVVTRERAEQVQARLLVEAGNIAVTPDRRRLSRRMSLSAIRKTLER